MLDGMPPFSREPPRSDRRRHAGHHPRFLTRQPAGNRLPESLPMLTPPPPADDPATASEDVQLDHFVDACSFPSQLLTFEMLRRPIEFTQYLSIRYTERLSESGIEPSVGSWGDSYDNALAESVIGLYKTEVIRKDGPWKGVDDVEFATLDWVSWFNEQRLLGPIGNIPPAEFEQMYYQQQQSRLDEAGLN